MYFKIVDQWYRASPSMFSILLSPFSLLFRVIIGFRRWLYQNKILPSTRLSVPVIVVGNITVGGTGKTPFVLWLVQKLKEQGYRPGIVSRGAGGKRHRLSKRVAQASRPHEVGDEALLLSKHSQCPVVVGIDRVAAAQYLLHTTNCNIVISDDGLQHYRLARDIEVVMVDGVRLLGNQLLLPAGPLREPIERLRAVDFVVVNGGETKIPSYPSYAMNLVPLSFVQLKNQLEKSVSEFLPKRVHAIAGIGHPGRFFATLSQLGIQVIPHAFPDHYAYRAEDILFDDGLPVIMTEKDAVKCGEWVTEQHWFLRVTAQVEQTLEEMLLKKILNIKSGGVT